VKAVYQTELSANTDIAASRTERLAFIELAVCLDRHREKAA